MSDDNAKTPYSNFIADEQLLTPGDYLIGKDNAGQRTLANGGNIADVAMKDDLAAISSTANKAADVAKAAHESALSALGVALEALDASHRATPEGKAVPGYVVTANEAGSPVWEKSQGGGSSDLTVDYDAESGRATLLFKGNPVANLGDTGWRDLKTSDYSAYTGAFNSINFSLASGGSVQIRRRQDTVLVRLRGIVVARDDKAGSTTYPSSLPAVGWLPDRPITGTYDTSEGNGKTWTIKPERYNPGVGLAGPLATGDKIISAVFAYATADAWPDAKGANWPRKSEDQN